MMRRKDQGKVRENCHKLCNPGTHHQPGPALGIQLCAYCIVCCGFTLEPGFSVSMLERDLNVVFTRIVGSFFIGVTHVIAQLAKSHTLTDRQTDSCHSQNLAGISINGSYLRMNDREFDFHNYDSTLTSFRLYVKLQVSGFFFK